MKLYERAARRRLRESRFGKVASPNRNPAKIRRRNRHRDYLLFLFFFYFFLRVRIILSRKYAAEQYRGVFPWTLRYLHERMINGRDCAMTWYTTMKAYNIIRERQERMCFELSKNNFSSDNVQLFPPLANIYFRRNCRNSNIIKVTNKTSNIIIIGK